MKYNLGTPVDIEVKQGNRLGRSLSTSLRDSLGNSLWDSLGESLWNSLGESLWNSLWNSHKEDSKR